MFGRTSNIRTNLKPRGWVCLPLLVLIGEATMRRSPAFAQLPDWVAEAEPGSSPRSVQVIEDADINYSNGPDIPFSRAAQWLRSLDE